MRHRDNRQRLIQKPAHARMLKRNLLTSLFLYETVRTTKSRAKAVQPLADRLIATAKKRPPHVAIRFINRYLTDRNASRKIIEVLIKRYADRPSGFTRVVAAGSRTGDGAQLVDFSLVDMEVPVKEEKKPAKKKATVKKSTEDANDAEEKASTAKKPAAKKTSESSQSSASSKKS